MPGPSDVPLPSSLSSEERKLSVEQTLLSEIITMYPDRLTPGELILWTRGRTNNAGRIEVLDALSVLKRSGLVRHNGEVVEPTYAAIRADEIFNA